MLRLARDHRSYFPLRTLFNEISTTILSPTTPPPLILSLNRDRLNPLNGSGDRSATPFDIISSQFFQQISRFFIEYLSIENPILFEDPPSRYKHDAKKQRVCWTKIEVRNISIFVFSPIPSSRRRKEGNSWRERGGNCKRPSQLAVVAGGARRGGAR